MKNTTYRSSFKLIPLTLTLGLAACSHIEFDPEREIAHEPASSILSCEKKGEVPGGARWDCDALTTDGNVKTLHIVQLRGDHKEIAYAHGYLMAEELENGVLGHTTEYIYDRINSNASAFRSGAMEDLVDCYSNLLRKSVSPDTLESIKAIHDGYTDSFRKKHREPRYSLRQAQDAVLGIEMNNNLEGLIRRVQANLGTALEIIPHCLDDTPPNILINIFDGIGESPRKLGGCLGFSLPKSRALANSMLHARNLDIDMVSSWNMHPTLFLVERKGKIPFVGSSAAGMLFPGGIGGMNAQGIAISLHQMSTTEYRSEGKNMQLAPKMTQDILENADSIEKAIEIVKNSKRVAAWTVFISDNKVNKSARIEFSANKFAVQIYENQGVAQSNHFLLPGMEKQAFTYNFNKTFESKSRLQTVEHAIAGLRGPAANSSTAVRWAIDRLAGHQEYIVDKLGTYSKTRAFGRTAVKAYNVQSLVMLPGLNQYWTTLGERNPAAHSTFVGFQIDWESFRKGDWKAAAARPIGIRRTQLYADKKNWERSLGHYVNARQAYTDAKGANLSLTLQELNIAIDYAEKDDVEEFPYYFMRARVLHEQALKLQMPLRDQFLLTAMIDWDRLWAKRAELHPYGQALVAMYSVASHDALTNRTIPLASDDRNQRLLEARRALTSIQAAGYDHFDLKAKLDLLKKMEMRGAPPHSQPPLKLPALDFVVVEN